MAAKTPETSETPRAPMSPAEKIRVAREARALGAALREGKPKSFRAALGGRRV